jgi:hypothetical protein
MTAATDHHHRLRDAGHGLSIPEGLPIMTLLLIAVVVPDDTRLDNLNDRLQPILDPYTDDTLDWWAAGASAAGIWTDPLYNPTADPANWTRCTWCDGTGIRPADSQFPGGACNGCAGPGIELPHLTVAGRPTGHVLTNWRTWTPHPGDIVPTTRLLDPAWRWRPHTAPDIYLDHTGWLDLPQQPDGGTLNPAMASRLRTADPDSHHAVVPVTAREMGSFVLVLDR